MSGHLSGKEKEEFQLLALTARKKDFVFFVGLLEKNNVEFTKTDTGITIEDMVIYEDLRVSFGRAKTYQYNLETLKRKTGLTNYTAIKATFTGDHDKNYIKGWNYRLKVNSFEAVSVSRMDGKDKLIYNNLTDFLEDWSDVQKLE
jgi:hypothetical protein